MIERMKRSMTRVIESEPLFLFCWFAVMFMQNMDPFFWEAEQLVLVQRYLLAPWGIALGALYLHRETAIRTELLALLALLAWMIVPFALRFGISPKNVESWQNMVILIGVYASISTRSAQERKQTLHWATTLFTLVGWGLGLSLLYCAASGKSYSPEYCQYSFGIFAQTQLTAGCHYNVTAMACLNLMLMSMTGFCCARGIGKRIYYAVPTVMMAIVVVLTQGRTSRYAMLAALALCAWRAVALSGWVKKAAVRHAAAIAAAAVVLIGGFVLSDELTNRAIIHYSRMQTAHSANDTQAQSNSAEWITDAIAEGTNEEQGTPVEPIPASDAAPQEEEALRSREAMNWTFTGRTKIWSNLANFWKENPKYFFIGYGTGRVGWLISQETPLESLGYASVHNTYLQFLADYGLMGMLLMAAFFVCIAVPLLREFFLGKWSEGGVMLCILIAAQLIIGMMESDPLAPMSICNLFLYIAFALAASSGREKPSIFGKKRAAK